MSLNNLSFILFKCQINYVIKLSFLERFNHKHIRSKKNNHKHIKLSLQTLDKLISLSNNITYHIEPFKLMTSI